MVLMANNRLFVMVFVVETISFCEGFYCCVGFFSAGNVNKCLWNRLLKSTPSIFKQSCTFDCRFNNRFVEAEMSISCCKTEEG